MSKDGREAVEFAANAVKQAARQLKERTAAPRRNRMRWAAETAAAAAVLCAAGWLFAQRFEIRFDPQVSSCIHAEFLLVDTQDRAPQRGEIFAFRSKGTAPVYADGTEMAKIVAAGPGDTVEVTPDFRVLVNGKECSRGLPHLSGMPTDEVRKRFCGLRVLGADEFWMTGTSPRSFDSRYWGPVRSEQMIGRAYVLW